MKIYLVQSTSELENTAGYSYGLLQAEQIEVLISFEGYQDRQTTIFHGRPPSGTNAARRARHLAAGKPPCASS